MSGWWRVSPRSRRPVADAGEGTDSHDGIEAMQGLIEEAKSVMEEPDDKAA